jgi:hypothetical protein
MPRDRRDRRGENAAQAILGTPHSAYSRTAFGPCPDASNSSAVRPACNDCRVEGMTLTPVGSSPLRVPRSTIRGTASGTARRGACHGTRQSCMHPGGSVHALPLTRSLARTRRPQRASDRLGRSVRGTAAASVELPYNGPFGPLSAEPAAATGAAAHVHCCPVAQTPPGNRTVLGASPHQLPLAVGAGARVAQLSPGLVCVGAGSACGRLPAPFRQRPEGLSRA